MKQIKGSYHKVLDLWNKYLSLLRHQKFRLNIKEHDHQAALHCKNFRCDVVASHTTECTQMMSVGKKMHDSTRAMK